MLIAQLTDTHIKPKGRLAYHQVDTAVMLRAAVDHLHQLPQSPDLVVITGDLVDQGSHEEYAHLIEILSLLKQPILVVPGNHDDRVVMQEVFDDLLLKPAPGFWQFSYQAPHWPLRLIGLDTVDLGQSGGWLCNERLAWLEAELEKDTHTPTLIMMHHPPFITGIGHMDDIGLKGREAFADIVRRHANIELITCGHLHRNIRSSVGGRSVMTGHSTAHTVQLDLAPDAAAMFKMEPPGYLLHFWNGEGLVTHHAVIGAFDGPHPFFADNGQLII
jgi:Icc protein